MRCGRCGNENSEGNRFCGMCGASLVPKAETANRTAASGAERRPESAITNSSGESRLPTRLASDVTVPAANRPRRNRLDRCRANSSTACRNRARAVSS